MKGRDYYDLLWFSRKPSSKAVSPNLSYLKSKLIQSGVWNKKDPLDEKKLKALLDEQFERVDWEQAKEDVLPFINDSFAIKVWSTEFFKKSIIIPSS